MRTIRVLRAAIPSVILFFAFLLLPAGCAEKPALLRVYFTTDVSGHITPCG